MAKGGSIFRDTADHLRPIAADNGYGTMVASPGQDEIVAADIRVGLIPRSIRRDPIVALAEGPMNMRRWNIAVRGTVDVQIGDAFHVKTGDNPGTYRVEDLTHGFTRATPTLAVAVKESTG